MEKNQSIQKSKVPQQRNMCIFVFQFYHLCNTSFAVLAKFANSAVKQW